MLTHLIEILNKPGVARSWMDELYTSLFFCGVFLAVFAVLVGGIVLYTHYESKRDGWLKKR